MNEVIRVVVPGCLLRYRIEIVRRPGMLTRMPLDVLLFLLTHCVHPIICFVVNLFVVFFVSGVEDLQVVSEVVEGDFGDSLA